MFTRYVSSIAAGGLLVASSIFGAAPLAIAVPSNVVAGTEFSADGGYIVAFKDGVNVDAEVAKLRRGGINPAFTYKSAFKGMATDLTPGQFQALSRSPLVKYIEANAIVTKHDVSVRPAGDLWGLDRIDGTTPIDFVDFSGDGTDGLYYNDYDGYGVDVYIIDTGILSTHEEFNEGGISRVDTERGASFVKGRNASSTEDCDGHGTHVAGTVGGETYGVAPAATLIPIRVLNCRGSGTNAGVIAGVDFVYAQIGASGPTAVANMSLGGGKSTLVDEAVERLATRAFVAVSAGNSSSNACNQSPAGASGDVVTVASSSFRDALSGFSNWGECVEIAAPGSLILSAMIGSDTATDVYSGTSMASPHVAGVAALILDELENPTVALVKGTMMARAQHDLITSNPSIDTSDAGPYPMLQSRGFEPTGAGDVSSPVHEPATNLSAVASRRASVVVSWTAPEDGTPSYYWLYEYRELGNFVDPIKFGVYFIPSSATEVRLNDLNNGLPLQYKIVAFYEDGNSGLSEPSDPATPR